MSTMDEWRASASASDPKSAWQSLHNMVDGLHRGGSLVILDGCTLSTVFTLFPQSSEDLT